jgi:hypothetical protein
MGHDLPLDDQQLNPVEPAGNSPSPRSSINARNALQKPARAEQSAEMIAGGRPTIQFFTGL